MRTIRFAEYPMNRWPMAKPNGVRHACCMYHFAAHANENLSAQQAGNSPAMVHSHHKELATKGEAKQKLAAKPPKSGKSVISLPARKGTQ
jgi:hypothetical protein